MATTVNDKTIIESVAKVLVIDTQRRVLVLTIGEYKEHPEKSFTPDLPGGLVDPGEAERDAAIREVKEETDIDIDADRVALLYSKTEFYPNEKKSVSKFLYMTRVTGVPRVTVSWEHALYEWVPIETLLKTKNFRSFYQEAIEYSIAHQLV